MPLDKSDPYSYPLLYDEQYWWKKNDLDFWRDMLDLSPGRRVLELGAGTGRVAKALLKQDIAYTGIDNSKIFIDYSKKQIKDDNAKFIIADMADFNINKKFDLIFIPFNTFLHNLTDTDARSCIESVQRHMTDGSLFIIDILVPDPLFLYRPDNIRFPIMEFHSSDKDTVVIVEETVQYNSKKNILDISWYYSTAEEKDFKKIKFKMRMFYNSEMIDMLNSLGISIKTIWGGYEREKYNEQSAQQIFCCQIT